MNNIILKRRPYACMDDMDLYSADPEKHTPIKMLGLHGCRVDPNHIPLMIEHMSIGTMAKWRMVNSSWKNQIDIHPKWIEARKATKEQAQTDIREVNELLDFLWAFKQRNWLTNKGLLLPEGFEGSMHAQIARKASAVKLLRKMKDTDIHTDGILRTLWRTNTMMNNITFVNLSQNGPSPFMTNKGYIKVAFLGICSSLVCSATSQFSERISREIVNNLLHAIQDLSGYRISESGTILAVVSLYLPLLIMLAIQSIIRLYYLEMHVEKIIRDSNISYNMACYSALITTAILSWTHPIMMASAFHALSVGLFLGKTKVLP